MPLKIDCWLDSNAHPNTAGFAAAWDTCIPYWKSWMQVLAVLSMVAPCHCAPWEVASDGSSTWSWQPTWETRWVFRFLTSLYPSPDCSWHMMNEPVNANALALSSLSFSFLFKYIVYMISLFFENFQHINVFIGEHIS